MTYDYDLWSNYSGGSNSKHMNIERSVFEPACKYPQHSSTHNVSTNKESYEIILFGQVTHTLDAAAMRVRSLFYLIHIL